MQLHATHGIVRSQIGRIGRIRPQTNPCKIENRRNLAPLMCAARQTRRLVVKQLAEQTHAGSVHLLGRLTPFFCQISERHHHERPIRHSRMRHV